MLNIKTLNIYLFWIIQIELLKIKKAFITILTKYFDYTNVFLSKFAIEFSKYISINNYIIKLKKYKQLSYNPIYNLKLVKLEILIIYVKINLVNSFIKSFK